MNKRSVFNKVMKQLFLDTKGKLSSKRTITFVAFAFVCVAFIVNLGLSIPMEQFVFEGMVNIVIGGAAVTAAEHFSPGAKSNSKSTVEDPELLEG